MVGQLGGERVAPYGCVCQVPRFGQQHGGLGDKLGKALVGRSARKARHLRCNRGKPVACQRVEGKLRATFTGVWAYAHIPDDHSRRRHPRHQRAAARCEVGCEQRVGLDEEHTGPCAIESRSAPWVCSVLAKTVGTNHHEGRVGGDRLTEQRRYKLALRTVEPRSICCVTGPRDEQRIQQPGPRAWLHGALPVDARRATLEFPTRREATCNSSNEYTQRSTHSLQIQATCKSYKHVVQYCNNQIKFAALEWRVGS